MQRSHGLLMSATLFASVLAVGSASADDGAGPLVDFLLGGSTCP